MLLLTLLAAFLPASLAVKCYICSWSPKDAANRTVICNYEYFEANAVAISDCESGCETYMHWDSNGDLEHVRRNCLQPETELTGDCKSEETILFSSRRCTCNSNLCNSGSILNVSLVVPISLLSLLLILHRLYSV